LLLLEQLNNTNTILVSFDLIKINPFTQYIKVILVLAAIIIFIISLTESKKKVIKDYEFLILIFLSLIGMLALISSNDLILLYLSIELFSLSLYILAAMQKTSEHSTEAGLKYFVLGSLSSGLLLFGCVILYIFTGETNFDNIYNIA